MKSETERSTNWSALLAPVLVVALFLLVVGIPTYPYWNYPEGPIRIFQASVTGASMISTSDYSLPKERVGIILPDGSTAVATVPPELIGIPGDLVTVATYRRKITKSLEYRVTNVVQKARPVTDD